MGQTNSPGTMVPSNDDTGAGRPNDKVFEIDCPVDVSVAAVGGESTTPINKSSKRKRSPSPSSSAARNRSDPPQRLSGDADVEVTHVRPKLTKSKLNTKPAPAVMLQFTLKDVTINVPAGSQDILLRLQPDRLQSGGQSGSVTMPVAKLPGKSAGQPGGREGYAPPKKIREGAGFMDLPPELRNYIYRLVFVATRLLDFARPINFRRTAALLRTCKQIHAEGRSILYSDNDFLFSRREEKYGSPWEAGWGEMSFGHVHKFLTSIGPTNISLIRCISFQFEDGLPSRRLRRSYQDNRRFVDDPTLASILRHLRDHSRLQTLKLNFHGRKRVEMTDVTILHYLRQIRADHVQFVTFPVLRCDRTSVSAVKSKQAETVRKMLLKNMVRMRKLYR